MNLTLKQFRSLFLLSTVLLLGNLHLIHHPVLGVLAGSGYFFCIYLVFKKSYGSIWCIPMMLATFMILGTIMYYSQGITVISSTIILLIPLLLLSKKTPPKLHISKINLPSLSFSFITFLLLQAILLFTLFSSRTTDSINSPWLTVGPSFFILYFIATLLLFYLYNQKNSTDSRLSPKEDALWVPTTIIHLFTTLSVAALIYPLGFGFDGFIHRATEVWIQNNGFILPKQPFYIGQYSLVVWLSNILAIPIFYIDVWLVPVLSAVLLPLTISQTLKSVWGIDLSIGLKLFWIYPLLFFLSLHLTTPFNLVLLLTILIVFAILQFLHSKCSFVIPVMLTIAALCTHALIGAPIALFVAAAFLLKHIPEKRLSSVVLLTYACCSALVVPVLFLLYYWVTGVQLPTIGNPFSSIEHFYNLFDRPYWFYADGPWHLHLVYLYERFIAPFLIVLGLVGFYTYLKTHKQKKVLFLFPVSMFTFWFGAFLLRSWIVFADVHALEQGDYPMRLIRTSVLFVLPFVMYAGYLFLQKARKKRKQTATIVFAIFIMLSFYLSYPQENPKMHFPGYNVTAADFEAAEFIQDDNEEYNYIVLSSPLTATAAMTNYGFPKYFETNEGLISYYSIPSGGKLFQLFTEMWSGGQKRETMIAAMDVVGVDKAYFVIPSFWTQFEKVISGAQKTADMVQQIDGGEIWIFEYNR